MQIDDTLSNETTDQNGPAVESFASGTELSDDLFEQKQVWNQQHRLEKLRGKPQVLSETPNERVLLHRSPRGRHLTEEHQRLDDSGSWQTVSVRPSGEPKQTAKTIWSIEALRRWGFATPPNTEANRESTTTQYELPVIPGCQRNYADRATALGFAAKHTLDQLGISDAVLITWLHDAQLISDETERRPAETPYMERMLSKVADVFPDCVIWLFGWNEVVVRRSSPQFDLFMKDVRLGCEWSGSKDAGRIEKLRATRRPLPHDLQTKIDIIKARGSTPTWLVTHCHVGAVVFNGEGAVVPTQEVLRALSNIPTARRQMRAERVGDKGVFEGARTMGQHALSIVEYAIKDSKVGTTQKAEQEFYRAASRNSGLFDVVIDTRGFKKIRRTDAPKLDAVIAKFLDVRLAALRGSGIQNQHRLKARNVEAVARFLDGTTRLVSNNILKFKIANSIKEWADHVISKIGTVISKCLGIVIRIIGKNHRRPP